MKNLIVFNSIGAFLIFFIVIFINKYLYRINNEGRKHRKKSIKEFVEGIRKRLIQNSSNGNETLRNRSGKLKINNNLI